ncbi:zinc finger domain-containing protein [Brachybacterium muris]|uniref:zinc finger domain-containing protein n=1 Tax=Brachybacterium muris TaxID=219301 RepID=UPI003B967F00
MQLAPSTRCTSTSPCEVGYFARSLHAYGRTGEPCARCGKLIRRTVHQGRSSHHCPGCQRPPTALGRPAATARSRKDPQ